MGYERWRLQRPRIPDDLICKRCDGVLRDPVHCKHCKGYFCAECLRDPPKTPEACEHLDTAEVNKYLKTKLGELVLCCRYKKQGCSFVGRMMVIEAHEKLCARYAATPPPSSPKSSDCLAQQSDCDFRAVICPRGCHKRMKANELSAHDCFQWLLTLTASQHDRNRRLKGEYEDAKAENEAIKEETDRYKAETDTEIKTFLGKLREVQQKKKAEEMKNTQREMGDSSYVRFREHTVQRLGTFSGKVDKELEEFFRQATEILRGQTVRSRQTLSDYTVKTKSEAASFSQPLASKSKSPLKSTSPSKSPNSSRSAI